MDNLLKITLASQDMGTSDVEKICKEVADGTFYVPDDAVSALIVWATTNEGDSDKDDIINNLAYAISQLKRAQIALENHNV